MDRSSSRAKGTKQLPRQLHPGRPGVADADMQEHAATPSSTTTSTARPAPNPKLFTNKHGRPLQICISKTVKDISMLQHTIESHGGKVIQDDKEAFIQLADPGYSYSEPKHSFTWVTDCTIQGKLLDHDTAAYKLRRSGSRDKTPFSTEDDIQLRQFIKAKKDKGQQINGNRIYQEFASTHPSHSWMSWRERATKDLKLTAPPSPHEAGKAVKSQKQDNLRARQSHAGSTGTTRTSTPASATVASTRHTSHDNAGVESNLDNIEVTSDGQDTSNTKYPKNNPRSPKKNSRVAPAATPASSKTSNDMFTIISDTDEEEPHQSLVSLDYSAQSSSSRSPSDYPAKPATQSSQMTVSQPLVDNFFDLSDLSEENDEDVFHRSVNSLLEQRNNSSDSGKSAELSKLMSQEPLYLTQNFKNDVKFKPYRIPSSSPPPRSPSSSPPPPNTQDVTPGAKKRMTRSQSSARKETTVIQQQANHASPSPMDIAPLKPVAKRGRPRKLPVTIAPPLPPPIAEIVNIITVEPIVEMEPEPELELEPEPEQEEQDQEVKPSSATIDVEDAQAGPDDFLDAVTDEQEETWSNPEPVTLPKTSLWSNAHAKRMVQANSSTRKVSDETAGDSQNDDDELDDIPPGQGLSALAEICDTIANDLSDDDDVVIARKIRTATRQHYPGRRSPPSRQQRSQEHMEVEIDLDMQIPAKIFSLRKPATVSGEIQSNIEHDFSAENSESASNKARVNGDRPAHSALLLAPTSFQRQIESNYNIDDSDDQDEDSEGVQSVASERYFEYSHPAVGSITSDWLVNQAHMREVDYMDPKTTSPSQQQEEDAPKQAQSTTAQSHAVIEETAEAEDDEEIERLLAEAAQPESSTTETAMAEMPPTVDNPSEGEVFEDEAEDSSQTRQVKAALTVALIDPAEVEIAVQEVENDSDGIQDNSGGDVGILASPENDGRPRVNSVEANDIGSSGEDEDGDDQCQHGGKDDCQDGGVSRVEIVEGVVIVATPQKPRRDDIKAVDRAVEVLEAVEIKASRKNDSSRKAVTSRPTSASPGPSREPSQVPSISAVRPPSPSPVPEPRKQRQPATTDASQGGRPKKKTKLNLDSAEEFYLHGFTDVLGTMAENAKDDDDSRTKERMRLLLYLREKYRKEIRELDIFEMIPALRAIDLLDACGGDVKAVRRFVNRGMVESIRHLFWTRVDDCKLFSEDNDQIMGLQEKYSLVDMFNRRDYLTETRQAARSFLLPRQAQAVGELAWEFLNHYKA
ncbi:hypothetical protein BGZ83_003961 [Gryganskiella cystojenkinii]|nr:hypothetical protein BGZ83_003961 [Gryganskiella cystojenkinii]